jgi:hypothetical protein
VLCEYSQGCTSGQYVLKFEVELPEWLPSSMVYQQTQTDLAKMMPHAYVAIEYKLHAVV